LRSCEITGAADSSIKNPVANEFAPLLAQTKIRRVYATGRIATDLFNRLCSAEAGMEAVYLPSTSPANRTTQYRPSFMAQWGVIARALKST
jgi:G:T/U-mismatch repair DNA glycosylase